MAHALNAKVLIRLREPSGRVVERSRSLPVRAGLRRLGIKPRFSDGRVETDERAAFDLIAIDGRNARTAAKRVTWRLVRLNQNYQWYRRYGRWTYETVTIPEEIAKGDVSIAKDSAAQLAVPVAWGRYRLEVSEAGANAAASVLRSTYVFTAGWHQSASAESPEVLDVAAERASYADGDEAIVRINARDAGLATVAILGDKLVQHRTLAIRKGRNEVRLPVAPDWGVGAYATVMLHRPMDTKQRRMPARALGLVWIKRAAEKRKLTVEIGGAEKVRSGSEVRLPLTVQGLAKGASAHVTVAAVDVGILNLTGFQAPDPTSVLHAQTKLGAEIRDLYGRLIDGMTANAGTLKSGGDADGGMQMSGPPPLERTVALFSGIIKVGPGGKAETTFQLPQFNGAVRLMAVVWNKQQIGHGTRDLIVRDPVALTLGAPRFLTIGDKTQLSIDLHNVEANAQDFAVTLRSARDGAPVRDLSTRTVGLKRGERRTVTVPFAPQDIGLHTVTVTITGTLDEAPMTVARDLTLDVKPAAADVRRTVTQTLKSGETLTLPEQLTSGLIATGSRIGISAGPSARFDVPGLLASLDRYPYGCTEQTISRALPLLYANGLSKSSGGAHDPALAKRIGDAVTRVLARQSSSGAFGLWSPFSDDIWLTAYAADFLSRARDAGQPVPERAFSQALDRLANFVNYTQGVRGDGADLAYALYALARNGRASSGTLRYYAETKLAAFKSPASKARVAAALAMIGDTATAERVFA
ncbi:MAG: alpha-2-macroglobulin family protein, partial [Pseudomonadota bacterium]